MKEEELQEAPGNGKVYFPVSGHPPGCCTDSRYIPAEGQGIRKRPVPESRPAEDTIHPSHHKCPYSAVTGHPQTSSCRNTRCEANGKPDYEDGRFSPAVPLYYSDYPVRLQPLLPLHTRQAYRHTHIPAY